jgi:hypothetical protein
LDLKGPAREAVASDPEALENAGKSATPKPDQIGGILESISGKLKMIGVARGETTALAEPASKIAAALRSRSLILGSGETRQFNSRRVQVPPSRR